MDNEDVYATPQSELEIPTDEIILASRWYRLWGALIDGLIGIVIGVGAMFVTGYWDRAMRQEITALETVGFGVFGFVMFIVIHGYFLAQDGQTVGKKMVGTRIVSAESNEILPLGKVLILRYLPITVIAQIPLIGGVIALVNYLFIFRKDKRCIHDLIAGTRVIKASAN